MPAGTSYKDYRMNAPEPIPTRPKNGAAVTEHDRDPEFAGDVQEFQLPDFEPEHRF